MIEQRIRRLGKLHGVWRGEGAGDYPTIEAFRYRETLVFELDSDYPMLHYEQRTVLLPGETASHWESGFIRATEDGSIEISNSQDSGRVEVLRGRLLDGGDAGEDDLRIELDSIVLDHDPRLVETRRIILVRGNVLGYTVYMATHTTPEPRLQQHLHATLRRRVEPASER
jgi:hypothetical protein